MPERWISLVEGGAALEPGDGRVWCIGAGCENYRCVVGPREAHQTSDPSCAHLLIHQ